jgi:glucose-6-phosphate isomerase
MSFDPGLPVRLREDGMGFVYGPGCFGPEPERRRLDAIRASLRDPDCEGPDPVYVIAMDTGFKEDREDLVRRSLLFGIVAYASGCLGREPVRSQGHVHAIAPHCGWSTPELFEIWQGRAVIYMQQSTEDDPGRCIAVEAHVGDQVVVPPGWAHCVINAEVKQRMVFGAWCERQYGFVYDGVRAHGGLAWFPLVDERGEICWERNPRYGASELERQPVRAYPELHLRPEVPIYLQYRDNPEAVQWISEPALTAAVWKDFAS